MIGDFFPVPDQFCSLVSYSTTYFFS